MHFAPIAGTRESGPVRRILMEVEFMQHGPFRPKILCCRWAGDLRVICYSWRRELQDLKTIKEINGGEAGAQRGG